MALLHKIVWITDTHLTASGQVEGVACRARLKQTVQQIGRHHGDAAVCIGTGDLTDTGAVEEYAAVSRLLEDLPMPFLPLIGNHDKRPAFRAAFPPPGQAMDQFQQFRWDMGDLTLLCLDTHSPGEDGGRFCGDRLAWVETQLADCKGRRVLVFMHHPPGPLWLGILDTIPLHDDIALIELLAGATNVEYLFCGHVHRPVSGVISGLPFTTLRSTAHQVRPGHTLSDWNDFVQLEERPQYGLILVASDRVVVQGIDLEDPA